MRPLARYDSAASLLFPRAGETARYRVPVFQVLWLVVGLVLICGNKALAAPPDLVPLSVSLSSTSLTAGGSETVTVTVKNQGTGSAVATTTMIRLNNTAGSSLPSDPIQQGVSTPAIAAGGSATVSATLTLSTAGTYYAHVYVDNYNVAGQTVVGNDTYHSGAITVSAAATPPDLVPLSVSLSSTSLTAGGSETVTVTVKNQGTGSAQATTTMIRLNNTAGSSLPSDPIQQGVATPAIAAGGSATVSATFTLSTAGTYYAHVYVDNYNVAGQTNVGNDTYHSGAITVSAAATPPDLVPLSVSLSSTSLTAGGSETVTVTVKNQGTGSAVATTTMIRLNNTAGSSLPSDPIQQGVATPAIAAGSSATVSATFTLSTAGTYYAHVYVDNYNVAGQTNVGNDTYHSGAITVSAAGASDLVPSGLSVAPTTVSPGGAVTVNFTVTNQGSATAAASVTNVRLSTSASTVTTSDPLLTQISTPSLGAGSSTTQSTTVTIPGGTSAGGYYVWIILDFNNAIGQSNVNNDKAVTALTVAAAGASDLVPSGLSVAPTTVSPGGAVTVNFTVTNQGSATAAASVTNVRLSTSASTVTTSDPLLTQISTPSLGAGSSTTQSTTVTIPGGTSAGGYYVWIILDFNNAIGQSNVNNDKAVTALTVAAAGASDLVPSGLSVAPTTVSPGGAVTVNFTVTNQGSATAAASVTNVRLSTSASTVTTSDPLLTQISTPSLGAGSSTTQSTTVTIPAGTSAGGYYVWIILDFNNAIGQSNVNNDKSVTALTVAAAGASDLVPSGLSVAPTTVSPGGAVTVNFTVANQGSATAAASVTNVRLSTSASTVTTSDPLLTQISTPSLGAGSSTTQSTTVTIPAGTSAGGYYVWIILDFNNAIGQSNVNNDKAVGALTVAAAGASDLVPLSVSLSSTSLTAGGSETVTVTVKNQGTGSAVATTTMIRLNNTAGSSLPSDPIQQGVSTPAIAAGGLATVSATFTLSTAGTYYAHVYVDNYNVAGQTNVGNDTYHSGAITVSAAAAPTAPTGLIVTSSSPTTSTLTWTDNSSNETGFKVERKTGAGGAYSQIGAPGQNLNFFNDSGLSGGAQYCYRVRATNATGDSGYSNEACVTTQGAATVPVAPGGLIATSSSSTTATLTWTDNSSNETGFKVERKTGAGGTYAQIGAPGQNLNFFNDSGLTGGTQYCYRVQATNATGDSGYSNEACVTTQGAGTTPGSFILSNEAPRCNSNQSSASPAVRLNWTVSAGATGYIVLRNGVTWSASLPSTQLSIDDSTITAGQAFAYIVQASNATGATNSNAVSVLVPGNVCSATTAPTANFTWSPASPVAGQPVQFVDASTGTPTAWHWTFGDGGTAATAPASHTFGNAGLFSVTLTVSNAIGVHSISKQITIQTAGLGPAAAFAWMPTNVVAGQTIQFSDLSLGSPTVWSWNFGDGASSTIQSPTHSFGQAGQYTVTLNVSGPTGPSSAIGRVVAVAKAGLAPVAKFTWNPVVPKVGDAVVFSDVSLGDVATRDWDFDGDGVADSHAAIEVKGCVKAGPRDVSLTVGNAYGRSNEKVTIFCQSVDQKPVITSAQRQLPGFFLKGAAQLNRYDTKVDWHGDPGQVIFRINNGPPAYARGSDTGATYTLKMSDFPAGLAPSAVTLVPVSARGLEGDSWVDKVFVFPFPGWLERTLGSDNAKVSVENGEVVTTLGFDFPTPHLAAEGPIDIPKVIPLLGGKFGLTETFARLESRIHSTGLGEILISGATGFTALGQEMNGRIEGTGSFRLGPPGGLVFAGGSASLTLEGTLYKQIGLVDAIGTVTGLSLPCPSICDEFLNKRITINGSIGANLALALQLGADPLTGAPKFLEATGKIGLDLKASIDGNLWSLVRARAWVSGGASVTAGVPAPFMRELEAHFQVGAEIKAKFWKSVGGTRTLNVACTWTPTKVGDVCTVGSNSNSLRASLTEESDALHEFRPAYEAFGPYSHFQPQARRPLRRAGPLATSETTLVTNVFWDASPILLPLKSGSLLLWVQQNLDLPAAQSTDIAWSVYSNGKWGTPSVIASDTRSDFEPVARVDRTGSVVAAWLRIKEEHYSAPVKTAEDLARFFKSLEVVTAVFDPARGVWGPVTSLTTDDAMDSDLKLSSDSDGRLLLTWLSNPSGVLTSDSSTPSVLMYSVWNGTTWEAPGTIASGLTGVGAHEAALGRTQGVVVTSRLDTRTASVNGEVIYWTWDGQAWRGPTVFASSGTDNRMPRVAMDAAGVSHIVWLRDGNLVEATLDASSPRVVRNGSTSLAFFGAKLISDDAGRRALVWSEAVDNGPANLFAAIFDPSSKTWSADVRLSQDDWQSHLFDGFLDQNGVLHGTYLTTEIGRQSANVEIGGKTVTIENIPVERQTDLRVFERSLVVDLAISDADLTVSPAAPRSGDVLSGTVMVHNTGDFSTGDFFVTLYNGESDTGGTIMATVAVPGPFEAGGTRTVPFSFTYPASAGDVFAVIDRENRIDEFTKSNNRASTHFVRPAPVAHIVASKTSGDAPLTVTLDASTSTSLTGGDLSFAWAFADGSAGDQGPMVTHEFTSTGRYRVSLQVKDSLGGIATSDVTITVGNPAEEGEALSERLIPIVLDVTGKGGAQFTSEVTLANRGTTTATVELTYTPALSLTNAPGGTVFEDLAPGAQKTIPSMISYLRQKGLSIPVEGGQGGTVLAVFRNLDAPSAASVTVRTTAPSGPGRAGLSYSGPKSEDCATSPVYLFGLRENSNDRSNVALVNQGETGPITLRVTLFAGYGVLRSVFVVSPDVTLQPGEWRQLNSVLSMAGYMNGYAKVERVAGVDRFLAYAVFNDNMTNDGSFVPQVSAGRPASSQVLPVLVETPTFESELVLSNPTDQPAVVTLSYVESLGPRSGGRVTVSEQLESGEQRIIPSALQFLRQKGAPLGVRGGSYAGALTVTFRSGATVVDGFVGARTSSRGPAGGVYGLFYPAIPVGEAASDEAWLYGLAQDDTSRSNVALVNVGEGGSPLTLKYEVYDGDTGKKAGESSPITLLPGAWSQFNSVLSAFGVRNGYLRVTRLSGSERFIAYSVVNDGASPGSGTDDGSYGPMVVSR